MKDLYDKINKAANIISQKQRYGSGNFIITNPKIVEALNNLDIIKIRKQKLQKIINRIKNNVK